ncbi:MAG: hypothetical protein RLZZ293_524 [Pseudomonadota bacterium]|jgi:hypothetical protein
MIKLGLLLIIMFFGCGVAQALEGRSQGAITNLCRNLSMACEQGESSSCLAYKQTGCACDQQGTCTRGNYSN